jgi:hypothetical protein
VARVVEGQEQVAQLLAVAVAEPMVLSLQHSQVQELKMAKQILVEAAEAASVLVVSLSVLVALD